MGEAKTINTEQAFDMLPYVADIYDKTNFEEYRKKLTEKYKGSKQDGVEISAAIDAFKFILKKSPKIKNEFFNIVAIAEGRNLEEVKKQSFVQTIKSVKQIFSDSELVDFFKEAMQ